MSNFDMKLRGCKNCGKDVFAYKPRILLMDMGKQEDFDFCDYKCLKEWLNENLSELQINENNQSK